jgi:alpha-beta hydrolase superfamily lysophospholipase
MRLAAVLLCAFVATACASYPDGIARDQLPAQQRAALDDEGLGLNWRQQENPAAVVVLVHGLNLDPAAMQDIQQLLVTADMDVLSVSLTGHANALEDDARLLQFQEATFAIWQEDIRQAVQLAGQRAAAVQRPLYLVGFSLGGLLSADYLVSQSSNSAAAIDRMVLLSPAISLRWSSYLLYPLQIFPDVFLPSVAPRVYRANDYAPVSAYLSLYDGVNQFNELAGQAANQSLLNIPSLVFMHSSDELVSFAGVREFIDEHQLTQWQFIEVDKSEGAADVLDHVIVGPHSLGEEAWRSVSQQMLDFLNSNSSTAGRQPGSR